jgi:hypothetical protein
MIVGKGEDRHPAPRNLVAEVHPLVQFRAAVNDGFVPRFRSLLDALPVAQPADISEVRTVAQSLMTVKKRVVPAFSRCVFPKFQNPRESHASTP